MSYTLYMYMYVWGGVYIWCTCTCTLYMLTFSFWSLPVNDIFVLYRGNPFHVVLLLWQCVNVHVPCIHDIVMPCTVYMYMYIVMCMYTCTCTCNRHDNTYRPCICMYMYVNVQVYMYPGFLGFSVFQFFLSIIINRGLWFRWRGS